MAILKHDKHKEYSRYAAHCLNMITAAKDQDTLAPFNAKWRPNG
jgi:hypothetical protein